MSFAINNKMDRSIATQLINFVNYLTTYELRSPNEENIILQRLKVLTSSSNQYIGFRCIDDSTNTYQVFSSHEHIPDNYKLGETIINDILPVRSIVFSVINDTVKVLDYSICRVSNISNNDFLAKMCNEETTMIDDLQANESYEGTVLVARYNETDDWNIRTTSCSAKDSYFASDRSHYTILKSIVPEIEEKLTDLKAQFDHEVYFVFVLASNEQKYLCDYKTSKLILISVRDSNTHEDLPVHKLAEWYDISSVVSSDNVKKTLSLEDNEVFNNAYLDLQGYIMTDHDGKLYRTFTNAYQYGCRKMPNNASMFTNALHCYLQNSFSTLVVLKSIPDEDAKVLAGHCKLVLNGIRNIFAYMYTLFTTLQVKQNELLNDNNTADAPKQRTSKSFLKKNGTLYSNVFNNSLQHTHTFGKLLAMLQKFSLSPKFFKESSEIANDVEKFFRSLVIRDDNNIKLMCEVLTDYKIFKEHLVDTVKQYNTTQDHKIRLYNYTGEELFLKVCSERIKTNTKTINIDTTNTGLQERTSDL